MKLLLFVVVSCLALHNGKGAPRTAVYNFVRCNPEGSQANCVTMQSPEMKWSPELPNKLPASAAQNLEAEPVEDERSVQEKEEEGTQMMSEEGESPPVYVHEEGSGFYEGSATDYTFMADKTFEIGSGESSSERYFGLQKGGESRVLRRLFPSRFLTGESKPEEHELREDDLMQA